MPRRRLRSLPAKPPGRLQPRFREQYDLLEARRAQMIARLHLLRKITQRHPGYKHALKLLNDTYRRQKLAERLVVLQAANWLIGVLEELNTLI